MGRLTTHVLDTASGRPAAGLRIDLYRRDGVARARLLSVTTNDDGRVDAPLMQGDDMAAGRYEIVFHAAAYLRAGGTALPEVPCLDEIVIAFGQAVESMGSASEEKKILWKMLSRCWTTHSMSKPPRRFAVHVSSTELV